jgi:hypothetical protein
VVKESRGTLNSVLQTIRKLCPRERSCWWSRTRATTGPSSWAGSWRRCTTTRPCRARVEQFHFGAEIRNVAGCERADQWRRRLSRAGFQSVPIRMAGRAREWLEVNAGGRGEGMPRPRMEGQACRRRLLLEMLGQRTSRPFCSAPCVPRMHYTVLVRARRLPHCIYRAEVDKIQSSGRERYTFGS